MGIQAQWVVVRAPLPNPEKLRAMPRPPSLPSKGLFALTDGGVALLRLDADEKPGGAMAMSIFPVQRKGREVRFRMTINGICPQWPTSATAGGRLPSVGFTEVTPGSMDEMGGLPKTLEFSAKSLC